MENNNYQLTRAVDNSSLVVEVSKILETMVYYAVDQLRMKEIIHSSQDYIQNGKSMKRFKIDKIPSERSEESSWHMGEWSVNQVHLNAKTFP